jgi:hypothetical protein
VAATATMAATRTVTATTEMKTGRARLLGARAWPLIALVSIVGCTSSQNAGGTESDPSTSTPASTSSPIETTSAPTTTTTPVAAPPAATTDVPVPPPDGPALLRRGFSELADGYHFVTIATVDGAVAVSANGDHIADRTRLIVTSGDATIGYIVTAEGSWVSNGDTWQELDEPAPVTDPITPLTAPIDVTVVAHDEASATMAARYPASALALPGTATITVLFETVGSSIRSISYTPPGDTQTFVRADISALVDTTPITQPSGDA